MRGSSSRFQTPNQYELDCQVLHSYFLGNGSINIQELVEVLADRSSNELKVICQTYGALYGHDLLHFLSAMRDNPVARAAYVRMKEKPERDAEIMRYSMYGGSVNLNTLIEVVCSRASWELQCIKQAYRAQYNSDVEQDVSIKISGGFKEILLAILKSCRYHSCKVDMSMAMCDAKTLYEAIESETTIDQRTILSLLSQRNRDQVKGILVSYKHLYGHEFSKSLKRSKCGQFGKELRIVVRCMQNPEKFFAKQLRMRNADGQEILIRIVATRSEIDIKEINKTFATKVGSSLEDLVTREFSRTEEKRRDVISSILLRLIKGC